MLTVQMQITIVAESTGYSPTLDEVNGLVQRALNAYVANLPPEDLASLSEFQVHGDLTEEVI